MTRFGCNIRLRLGLHDAGVGACSNSGLMLLQICGEQKEADALLEELKSVPHVKAKLMSLDF